MGCRVGAQYGAGQAVSASSVNFWRVNTWRLVASALLVLLANVAGAQERIELESIYVKGNKEFPQTLYVVPWKDIKGKNREEQPLVLHSLFGDLFDPVSDMGVRTGGDERLATPK